MSKITINDIEISYKKINQNDYISLTDLAKYKNSEIPAHVISHWLSTKPAVEFNGVWEKVHNPNFNVTEFREFKNESGGSFTLSPKQWIEKTNAIGMVSKAGRYDGGTFAHKDIAFEFATWLSAEFKFYVITEFQKLKESEQSQLQWSAKRELARINYRIHTDAIKENIVPTLNDRQKTFVYADEADLLNVVLFGKTAKEAGGNMRDTATIHQLLVLANMESYNAILIKDKLPQADRMTKLSEMASQQLKVLMEVDNKLLLPKGEIK